MSYESYVLVALGGAFGAMGRFAVSQFADRWFNGETMLGTLTCNVIGGLLMGLVAGVFSRGEMSDAHRLFLATGVLGGFTTFSAFSLEIVRMMEQGLAVQAAAYGLASMLLSAGALGIGLAAVRAL